MEVVNLLWRRSSLNDWADCITGISISALKNKKNATKVLNV